MSTRNSTHLRLPLLISIIPFLILVLQPTSATAVRSPSSPPRAPPSPLSQSSSILPAGSLHTTLPSLSPSRGPSNTPIRPRAGLFAPPSTPEPHTQHSASSSDSTGLLHRPRARGYRPPTSSPLPNPRRAPAGAAQRDRPVSPPALGKDSLSRNDLHAALTQLGQSSPNRDHDRNRRASRRARPHDATRTRTDEEHASGPIRGSAGAGGRSGHHADLALGPYPPPIRTRRAGEARGRTGERGTRSDARTGTTAIGAGAGSPGQHAGAGNAGLMAWGERNGLPVDSGEIRRALGTGGRARARSPDEVSSVAGGREVKLTTSETLGRSDFSSPLRVG